MYCIYSRRKNKIIDREERIGKEYELLLNQTQTQTLCNSIKEN